MMMPILILCQCPLGLVPHCYLTEAHIHPLDPNKCQCPLGLVPHCYVITAVVNGDRLSVSMPSRASTSLLHNDVRLMIHYYQQRVSMPSRASTSLLRDSSGKKKENFSRRVNALSG